MGKQSMTYYQQNRTHRFHKYQFYDVNDPTGLKSCMCGKRQDSKGGENKYGAIKTEFNGFKYDSRREADIGAELELKKRAGHLTEIRRQVPLRLEVNGEKVGTYKIDFEVIYPDGLMEWIEVKGAETFLWRLKRDILLAMHKKELQSGDTLKYTVIK